LYAPLPPDGQRANRRARPQKQRRNKTQQRLLFPVDIRHNAKIFREKLARWAAVKLA